MKLDNIMIGVATVALILLLILAALIDKKEDTSPTVESCVSKIMSKRNKDKTSPDEKAMYMTVCNLLNDAEVLK